MPELERIPNQACPTDDQFVKIASWIGIERVSNESNMPDLERDPNPAGTSIPYHRTRLKQTDAGFGINSKSGKYIKTSLNVSQPQIFWMSTIEFHVWASSKTHIDRLALEVKDIINKAQGQRTRDDTHKGMISTGKTILWFSIRKN
jgi:hypothetical protein